MDPGTQERGCPGAQESRIGTTQFPADGDWHGNPNERTSPDPVVPVLDGVPRAVPLARHRVRHLGLPGWWISPFVPSGSCEGFSPKPTGAATETGAEPHTARAEALAESLSSQTRVGNAALAATPEHCSSGGTMRGLQSEPTEWCRRIALLQPEPRERLPKPDRAGLAGRDEVG